VRGLLKRVKRRLLHARDESNAKSVVSESRPVPPPAPEIDEEPMNIEIEGDELAQLHQYGGDYLVIDIREPYELSHGVIAGSIHIPMNSIPSRIEELPAKSEKIVIYCAHGVRSFGVTAWLREQGWEVEVAPQHDSQIP
jgi:rhodanese-related sulfurtransferase